MNKTRRREAYEYEMDDEEKSAFAKGREDFKKGNVLTIKEMLDTLKISKKNRPTSAKGYGAAKKIAPAVKTEKIWKKILPVQTSPPTQ